MAHESRTKPLTSHIPVMAPRPSQSSLPSSLSTPQFGLGNQGRFLAVSGSPSYPAVTGTSAGGGLAPFRSFRNLLPFGSGKHTSGSSSGNPGSTTGGRTSLGGLRRSATSDRSLSAPHLPTSRKEEPPVLAIELAHPVDEPLFQAHELRDKLGVEPATPTSAAPSPISSSGSHYVNEQPYVMASDLSTIIEAETSRITRHPSNDGTQGIRSRISPGTLASRTSHPDMQEQDTYVLDLSTTNVGQEVLAALSATDQKREGWLNGVVVEDVEPPSGNEDNPETDVTFNFSALDKDLADLLKSKRPTRLQPTTLTGMNAPSPPLLTPPLTEAQRNPRTPSPRMTLQELGSPARSPTTVPNSPMSSPRYSKNSKTSSPLSRTSSLARAPPSTLSRLPRSSLEKSSYSSKRSPLSSPTKPDYTGRQSLQLSATRTSPSLREDTLPARPTSSDGTDPERRRAAISRLATPSRNLAASNIARASQRHAPSSPGWDGTASSSSRVASAYGSASVRRTDAPRNSLEKGDRRAWVRGRDRSSSLTESIPPYNPNPNGLRSHEWMGPRTAKVFAAAGLLDEDREQAGPSVSRPGTRFGFNPSRSERDFRSQYAPSRAGFSEVGSATSWGRRSGSISHPGTGSEVYSVMGTPESVATPYTTYSASTAPTSISAVSSMQKHLESELQRLEDKHATETGALLHALADSQRTTRILREENAALRDRVQSLEDELAKAQEALHRPQFTPPFATSTLPRSNPYRIMSRQGTEPLRRPIPHSRLQTLLQPNSNNDNDNNEDDKKLDMDTKYNNPMPMNSNMPTMPTSSTLSPYASHLPDTKQRRYSSSSSIFAPLPSNMPMLLQEDGESFAASPPSPVRQASKQSSYNGHHRNTSSAGNISPTTANFSIVTGSPRSLDLQSEHERLLGDMPTLDLHGEDYESHVFHDI